MFIPSTTELGDTKHEQTTYQIGNVYTFFSGVGDEERIAMMVGDGWPEIVEKLPEEFREGWGVDGNVWLYWTRSPYSYDGTYLDCVLATGAFLNNNAYDGTAGVRPALNLESGVLVSEISP